MAKVATVEAQQTATPPARTAIQKAYITQWCAIAKTPEDHKLCNFGDVCNCKGCDHSEYIPREYNEEQRANLNGIAASLKAIREEMPEPVTNTAAMVRSVSVSDAAKATNSSAISSDPKVIRVWAIANGWPNLKGQRGRMPREVFPAYAAAHCE